MNRRSLLCLLAVMLSLIIAIGGCASPPQAIPGGPSVPKPNPVPSIADVKLGPLPPPPSSWREYTPVRLVLNDYRMVRDLSARLILRSPPGYEMSAN